MIPPFPQCALNPPTYRLYAVVTPRFTLKTVRHRFLLGYCLSISLRLLVLDQGIVSSPPPDVGLAPTTTRLKGVRSTD